MRRYRIALPFAMITGFTSRSASRASRVFSRDRALSSHSSAGAPRAPGVPEGIALNATRSPAIGPGFSPQPSACGTVSMTLRSSGLVAGAT